MYSTLYYRTHYTKCGTNPTVHYISYKIHRKKQSAGILYILKVYYTLPACPLARTVLLAAGCIRSGRGHYSESVVVLGSIIGFMCNM